MGTGMQILGKQANYSHQLCFQADVPLDYLVIAFRQKKINLQIHFSSGRHTNSDVLGVANSKTKKKYLLWKVTRAMAKHTSKSVKKKQNSSKDLKTKGKCCLAEWLLESPKKKQIQFMRDLKKNFPCQVI